MGNLVLSFPPPRNWQDFEQLTKDVAKFRLNGDFENYGRQGQGQKGIDIFGFDKDNRSIGLQCKHKVSTTAKVKEKIVTTVTPRIIKTEVENADNFVPKLERLIIATTSFRDVALQDFINSSNVVRDGKKAPRIEMWTWEIFEEEINRHSELAYIYYERILKNFSQYNKDSHILGLLRYSLDRPAFKTPFHSENHCEDFIQAIIDTQRAFSTGKLCDRDGNLLASAYSCNYLEYQPDREEMQVVAAALQKIRLFVTENFRQGNIYQQDSFLYFRNDYELKISETLNNERRFIIERMNIVLTSHKIDKIIPHL